MREVAEPLARSVNPAPADLARERSHRRLGPRPLRMDLGGGGRGGAIAMSGGEGPRAGGSEPSSRTASGLCRG